MLGADQSALALTALTAAIAVGAVVGGLLSAIGGERLTAVLGVALTAAGLYLADRVGDRDRSGSAGARPGHLRRRLRADRVAAGDGRGRGGRCIGLWRGERDAADHPHGGDERGAGAADQHRPEPDQRPDRPDQRRRAARRAGHHARSPGVRGRRSTREPAAGQPARGVVAHRSGGRAAAGADHRPGGGGGDDPAGADGRSATAGRTAWARRTRTTRPGRPPPPARPSCGCSPGWSAGSAARGRWAASMQRRRSSHRPAAAPAAAARPAPRG